MKRQVGLSDVQRQYLIELVSIDRDVNGAIPIHDSEIPPEVNMCDGMSNLFRSYLIGLLNDDLNSEQLEKIGNRYWTGGRLGDIIKKL